MLFSCSIWENSCLPNMAINNKFSQLNSCCSPNSTSRVKNLRHHRPPRTFSTQLEVQWFERQPKIPHLKKLAKMESSLSMCKIWGKVGLLHWVKREENKGTIKANNLCCPRGTQKWALVLCRELRKNLWISTKRLPTRTISNKSQIICVNMPILEINQNEYMRNRPRKLTLKRVTKLVFHQTSSNKIVEAKPKLCPWRPPKSTMQMSICSGQT